MTDRYLQPSTPCDVITGRNAQRFNASKINPFSCLTLQRNCFCKDGFSGDGVKTCVGINPCEIVSQTYVPFC